MNHIIASVTIPFFSVNSKLAGSLPPVLAQTTMQSVGDFKNAAGTIVAILLIVAFVSSLILWYVGTLQKESNPASSKWCFQAVWFTAIGLPFISLMFYIFFGGDSVVSAKF
jgi:ABC-type arginine transport system permease subunit